VELEVRPYLEPCNGFAFMSCMVVKDTQVDTTAGLFSSPIEGFQFEWDRQCVITVEKTPIQNPPEDGASIRYVLVGSPSCTPSAQWSFEAIYTAQYGQVSGDTLHIMGYAKPIRLLDAKDRDSLAVLSPTDRVILTVQPGEGTWLKGSAVRKFM
jgi:hypothetical protein